MGVEIAVRGKNFQVSPALRQYVEKRVGKLEKLLGDSVEEAQVTLSVEKDRHKVEVTIPIGGLLLRGEEETGDMYASVDMVVEKLDRQVEKYKTRLSRQFKGRPGIEPPAAPETVPEEKQQLIRTKRFAVKPMPVEEAIMQMNLIGHSFFVFSNAETEQVNVVYRRRDGNYGLIEPEI